MSFFNSIGNRLSTKSKSKKSIPTGTPLFLTQPYVRHSSVTGNFKPFIVLPKYVDQNEWIASNTFEFFNYVNLFYETISAFCTPHQCPTMSAGTAEYQWSDPRHRSSKIPAPQYIDYVMTWIQNYINDENVFPTKSGAEFSKNFIPIIREIFKQLFRVFAHIFWNHYDKLINLDEEGHFNTLFAHFMSFAKEFDLIDKKELAPLMPLIEAMQQYGTIC